MGIFEEHRPLRSAARRGAGLIAIAALTLSLVGVQGSAAWAMDEAASGLTDPELIACVNAKLGGGRAPDATVTADDVAGVTALSCDRNFSVTSLAGLEGATKLNSLSLTGGGHDLSAAGALDALASAPKLATLFMTGAQVTDASLPGLAGAPLLATVTLKENPELSDLSPLGTLPKLRKLDIFDNPKVSDLSPLADRTLLTDLTAGKLPLVTDLSPLRNLTALTYLNVQKNAVTSLSPLSGLTALTSLTASMNPITSLEPLAALTAMRNLDVQSAQLTSLRGIEDMVDLRTLDIAGNATLNGKIDEIAGKPQLTRIHMNAVGASDTAPLSGLTSLTNLQALGNHFASIVGLPAAPGQVSTGTFAVTAQQVPGAAQYVPKGAKTFRYDVTGDLELRDGSFPAFGGNQVPTLSPEFPLVDIKVYPAIPQLEYSFSENPQGNDRFAGTVGLPIVWSTIESIDSATIAQGTSWSQPISYTSGFPAASFALAGDVPEWVAIDPSDGTMSGTPDEEGDWAFELRVADALGNTMTQRVHLSVPAAANAVVEIGADQTVEAPGTLEFTVTRSALSAEAWQGAVSVDVATLDGTATAGVDYVAVSETLTWDANDTSDRIVRVDTLPGSAGGENRAFTLELSNPSAHAELGAGFSSDGIITYPVPEPTTIAFGGDQVAEAGESFSFVVSRDDAQLNPWTGEASVRVTSQDETAISTGDDRDYDAIDTTVTWAAGETGPQLVEVTTYPGNAGDDDREFELVLSDPAPTSFTQLGSPAHVTGTMTFPEPELTTVEIEAPQGVRAGETVQFSVTRTDAAVNPWLGAVTARVITTDGTAIAGEHYVSEEVELRWEAGDTDARIIEVATLPVAAGDPDRSFELVIADTGTHTTVGNAAGTATIAAAVPGTTVFTVSGEPRELAGRTLEFTVERADAESDPWTGIATVNVATQDGTARAGTHYVPVAETLSWNPGDTRAQTVAVRTMPVPAGDPERTFSLVLSGPTPVEYSAIGAAGAGVGTIVAETKPDPGTPTDPGESTDPGEPTDPGGTTEPGGPAEPGGTSDPQTPRPPTAGPGTNDAGTASPQGLATTGRGLSALVWWGVLLSTMIGGGLAVLGARRRGA